MRAGAGGSAGPASSVPEGVELHCARGAANVPSTAQAQPVPPPRLVSGHAWPPAAKARSATCTTGHRCAGAAWLIMGRLAPTASACTRPHATSSLPGRQAFPCLPAFPCPSGASKAWSFATVLGNAGHTPAKPGNEHQNHLGLPPSRTPRSRHVTPSHRLPLPPSAHCAAPVQVPAARRVDQRLQHRLQLHSLHSLRGGAAAVLLGPGHSGGPDRCDQPHPRHQCSSGGWPCPASRGVSKVGILSSTGSPVQGRCCKAWLLRGDWGAWCGTWWRRWAVGTAAPSSRSRRRFVGSLYEQSGQT